MRVIIKEPNKKAYITDIENELKPMQQIVGGYIEALTYKDNCLIICNEEGKLRGLEPNIYYGTLDCIVGTIIVCGADLETGEFVDVPVTLERFDDIVEEYREEG